MKLTIAQIKQRIQLPDYINGIIPIKKNGKEYVCLCLFHNDSNPSMQIYRKNGEWKFICQPCGSRGDLIDFISMYYGTDYKGAIKILRGENEDLNSITPRKIEKKADPYADFEALDMQGRTISVGEKVFIFNPKTGKPWEYTPVLVHKYHDGYVIRLIVNGKKWTPTVRWCRQISTNLTGWTFYSFAKENRRIYGELKPFGQVIIVEGEKAADAGMRIFKDTDTSFISWAGGTNQVSRTDWTVLDGRSVIGIPDNDSPGYKVMCELSEKITDMKLIMSLGEPKGFDIADRDFTRDGLIEWMTDRIEI